MLTLNGSDVAAEILNDLAKERANLIISPTLAIIRIGAKNNDLAYERGILKKFSSINFSLKVFSFSENMAQNDFDKEFDYINNNPAVHGILMFRPLPEGLDDSYVRANINPVKDIDCMGYINVAKLFSNEPDCYAPCTAESAIKILDHYKIDLAGKNITVIGRSMVIGRPVASMLISRDATVTVCNSHTQNLKDICKASDIIITATGKAKFLNRDYVNEDSIIIDVGINTDENKKLCGDVDFDDVSGIVKALTPVPGGVGAVTTSVLAKNLLTACSRMCS